MQFVLVFALTLAACVAANKHLHQRAGLVSDRGVSTVTGVSWSVTANPSGGGYLVQFGANDFPANSYIALGLSASAGMPQTFILSCLKSASGQLSLQQRYAAEHVKPPIFDWGAQVQKASVSNTCSAVVPAMFTNAADPENKPVAIGTSASVYVISAAGELDAAGDIKYHGVKKDDTRTLSLA